MRKIQITIGKKSKNLTKFVKSDKIHAFLQIYKIAEISKKLQTFKDEIRKNLNNFQNLKSKNLKHS